MASLVPGNGGEVTLLQTYSVNKLLENFNYDLIFPMDLHGDSGGGRTEMDNRGKLQPLRTSFGFDEFDQFEETSTPSSVQSDYFSFGSTGGGGGGGGGTAPKSHSNNTNNWYSSRPNISHSDQDNNLLFSPPKRYLSDSNLSHYQFGGDTTNVENSMYSGNHRPLTSPFKGGASIERHPPTQMTDYETHHNCHTRSAFNINYNNNASAPSPAQKMDKYDLLNLLALNSSSSPDSFASNMKGLEQTMRMLQSQQQQQSTTGNNYFEQPTRHHSFSNHFHQHQQHLSRQNSGFESSSNYSRQNSSSGDENTDFLRHLPSVGTPLLTGNTCTANGCGANLRKYNNHNSTTNTSNSTFSSCSSIDMNGNSSGSNSVRTWNGVIPTRTSKAVTYSQKVFLGGIPWETSEESLKSIFGRFGPLRVEWPGKDPNFSTKPKGCVYIIFENEKQVRDLLAACQMVGGRSTTVDDGKYFYKFPWKNMKTKNVEVIPWNIADSNYVSSSQILDPTKTIFVGALHGKLTAEGLALIMNDLFDGVVYAGIDTDKHKYPLGAGRVTFNNAQSYMKAIQTGYLLIKTPVFTKKVQIDPYLEDNLCSSCKIHHGPYYCRELTCFRYFCRVCWQLQHNDSLRAHHRPLTRNSKSQSIVFND